MKKLPVLLVFLFLFVSSYGQNTINQPVLRVMLGRIAPIYANGKETTPVATREEILANTKLTMPPPSFEVLGFRFTMMPDGANTEVLNYITVTGAELTPAIKKMLTDLKNPRARIFIDDIRVKVGDKERSAQPIILYMSPKE